MSVSVTWVKPLLEVLESKTSIKVLGAVFVISLAALCLPRSWKDHVYMTPWISWLWPWLVVACVFCGLMLIFTGVDVLIVAPMQANSAIKKQTDAAEDRLKKILESLGEDDKQLLYNPIKSRQMAFSTGTLHYHIAKSLEKRGILSELPPSGGRGSGFAIDHAVFAYLTKHPELVGIKTDS